MLWPGYAAAADEKDDPLAEGWTSLFVRNYPRAEALFREAAAKDNSTTVALRARLGDILIRRYDPARFRREKSLTELEGLLKEIPESDRDLRALVMVQIAECYFPSVQDSVPEKRRLREQMDAKLEEVIRAYPGSRFAAEAAADCALDMMENNGEVNGPKALALLEKALAETKDTSATATLYQALANQNLIMKNWEAAERYYQLWLDAGIETEWIRVIVLYMIATLNHNELKRPEKARIFYERLGRDYPQFMVSSEARRRAKLLGSNTATTTATTGLMR